MDLGRERRGEMNLKFTNGGPFADGVLRDPIAILSLKRIGIWNPFLVVLHAEST
jgi:hypothetical protein